MYELIFENGGDAVLRFNIPIIIRGYNATEGDIEYIKMAIKNISKQLDIYTKISYNPEENYRVCRVEVKVDNWKNCDYEYVSGLKQKISDLLDAELTLIYKMKQIAEMIMEGRK